MPRDSSAYTVEREPERLSFRNDHNERLVEPVDGKVSDLADTAFGDNQEKKDLLDGRKDLASFSPEEKRGITEQLKDAFHQTDFDNREELRTTAFEVSDRLLTGTYRDLDRLEAQSAYVGNSQEVGKAEAYADPRFDNRTLEALDRLGVNYRGEINADGSTSLNFQVENRQQAEAIRDATGHQVTFQADQQEPKKGWLERKLEGRQERQRERQQAAGPGSSSIPMHNPRDYSDERREIDIIRSEMARILEQDRTAGTDSSQYMGQLMEEAVKYSTGERTAENRERDDFTLMENLKDDPDNLREFLVERIILEGKWDRNVEALTELDDESKRAYGGEMSAVLEHLTEQTLEAVDNGSLTDYSQVLDEARITGAVFREAMENDAGILQGENYSHERLEAPLNDSDESRDWMNELRTAIGNGVFDNQDALMGHINNRLENLSDTINRLAEQEASGGPQLNQAREDVNRMAHSLSRMVQQDP